MMKHPACSCPAYRPPKSPCHCRPRESTACILLPRVIAQGRTWQRCMPTDLHLEDLPPCLPQPVTLIHAHVSGDATWLKMPCTHPRQMMLNVCIPLACTLQDCCGQCHTCCAQIEYPLCLDLTCPESECWRSHATVFPQVRLVCSACCDGCGCHAQLELLLEGYLLRWEKFASSLPCKPTCPQLPLYPQPCPPPCR